ncbi:interleukin-like EMT inducer domain-containing protein [Clostridium sp. B9]|uniref:interleukin-like EMT inducer domain-containing protein n=1 Tax=Clostridium sp. B9 TaxID=3423224 RepID=UPI003D2F25A8
MFNVSKEFNQEINKLQDREFNAKVIIRDKEFSGSLIYEMSLEESVNPSDNFSIGTVCSNTFEIKLINTGDIFDNAVIKPYVGLYIGEHIEYVPLGVFNVIKTSVKGKFINLDCVDNMLCLEKVYFSDLSYPADINDIAKEICKKAGVNFASKLPNYIVNKIEGYSLREAIGIVASLCGSFARFNRIGDLEIKGYEFVNQELDPNNIFKLDIEADECFITKVIAKRGEDELSKGSDEGISIAFNNPVITEEILDGIYQRYRSFRYIPYSLKWKGNPAIMAGDILNLTDLKGKKYNALVMEQKFTYKNGIVSELKAKGKGKQESNFDSKGSVTQSMERYSIEQANIKKALIDKASINDLTAIDAKIQRLYTEDLTVIRADIVNLNSKKADIVELNAVRADLQQAVIGKANITDLNAAVGKISVLESKTISVENQLAGNLTADNFKTNAITAGSAVIAEGAIGSSQISSLSVNKLEAGDITTSKHRIVSADGTIEIVGNQILINRNNINRVILGEYRKTDGTTEYGLLVRAKDGKTIMLDGNGVHNAGITDGAIDNNKVADNANIAGNKLDINSVIREVNNKGTETIKGTKVQIGDRTLDVELSTQKNIITEHGKELSSQKATIQALDNAIKLKVDSQTFTQSTTTINNNINRAKEEAINTANSNTTNAINNLEFGGRNLVLDSLVNESSSEYAFAIRKVNGLEPNTEYIFSANGFIKSNNEKKSLVVYIYPPDWSWGYNFTLPYDKAETRFIKFRTPNEIKKGVVVRACCSPNSPAIEKNLATLNWYKVEKGNKATDWTPAPEDLQAYADEVAKAKADLAQANAIANADGKITEEERKRIQQAEANLNTAIAKADKAKQDAINEANRVAELKKQEAINSASADATSKANSALNSAKTFVNVEITTVNSHLNKATSEINILKEQILTKVSQSDIDRTISNMVIGGRNLVCQKNISKVSTTGTFDAKTNTWSLVANSGANSYWGAGLGIVNGQNIKIPFGQGYIFSFEIKVPIECEWNTDNNNYASVGSSWSGNDNDEVSKRKTSSKQLSPNKWIKCWFYYENTSSKNTNFVDIYDGSTFGIVNNTGASIEFKVRNIKGELGNKPTDWTPAPEDTNQLIVDNIKTVTDKISTVESKFTQENNSIKASVQDLNSTTQSITTNVSNINRDLTSKINSNLDVAKRFATDIAIAKANLAKEQAIANADGKITEEERKRIAEAKKNLDTAIARADKAKQDAINTASTDATNKANSAKQQAIIGARSIPDTRNNNESPGWYIEHYPKQTITEFKFSNVVQIPGSKVYGTLETKVPWADSSGGYPTQVFRSNSTATFQRHGVNNTTWSAWEQIEDTQGAQDKANGALNNAKAYTNAQITTVNSKVHNVESNLNILSDRINSKVSQSDIDKAVTTIRTEKIIYARGTGNDYPANSIVKVNGKTITDGQGRGLRINALNKATLERVFLQDYDTYGSEDAKVSFVNKINELNNGDCIIIITSQDASYPLHPPIKEALEKIGATLFDNKQGTYREAYALIGKSKLGRGNGVEMFIPRTATDKRFAEVSVKVGEDGTFIGVNPNNMGLETTLIKSNISDVSSSVTQLRDSVTTDIRAINSKTNSIETSLNGKASKQEVTEVNNQVATIKASLDGISQRVSYTESKTRTLETNLNGKANKQEVNNVSSKVVSLEANLNGITNRVSSTESRINTLNGQVANAVTRQQFTEFQQSNNKFVMDLASSGGSNLVRNSAFESQDWRNWTKWGSIADPVVWKNNEPSGHTWACKIVTTRSNQGIQQRISGLIIGKVYTFSCKVWSTRGVIGAMVSNAGVYNGNHFGGAQNVWGEINFTFTAKENTTTLYLGVVNSKCTPGDYWVTGIQLTEGNCKQPWSQHPNENYNTNYSFDNEGFTARFKNSTYTKIAEDGFAWFDANNMSHAYHCLMETGIFNLQQYGNGNYTRVKIQLPAYFRGKYFKVIACPSGWSVGQSSLDTLTVLVESYDIANATFTIKAFGHSANGAYQNNINISWMATA